MRVDVHAQKEGTHYVIECSACGMLGVCVQGEARDFIIDHLETEHGVEEVEEGGSSEHS